MMFFCEMFFPNLRSATQGTLAVKDQSCYVSVSIHLLGEKELVVLFSPFLNFLNCSFASRNLVSVTEAVAVCCRQH